MQIEKPALEQITTLKNLPTLPHILLKLIEACNKDTGSLKEVSIIVEKDPSITVKILKLVNSVYYGLPKKVENIDHAVTLAGINAIRNIAICASVYEAFNNVKGNKVFNLKLFWWHSLKCAILSRHISRKIGFGQPDEAFLAGLLHDIGKLVLWVNFLEQYESVLEKHKGRDDLLLAAEKNLAASHCEIGAWLLNRWNFKTLMSDSILYHHEPHSRIAAALPLVQIIHIANALSQCPIREKEKLFSVAEKILQLNPSEVENLLTLSDKETQEVAHLLQIEIEVPDDEHDQVSGKDFKTQAEIVKTVQEVSLLFGTLQNLLIVQEPEAILKVIRQGLQLLFDITNVVFFLYDPEKDSLIGKISPEDKRFADIQDQIIPLQMEKSLLVSCLRRGKQLDSFSRRHDQPPAILDQQIQRLLGKEGIVCLPMTAQQEYVGVIVIGLDRADFSHLADHYNLLHMFAGQAALALQMEYHRRSRLKTIQSERIGASAAIAQKVCHEVNNPLGIIKNYLKILGKKLAEQDIGQAEIEIINEEIDRMAHILKQLSDFSQEGLFVVEAVDINRILADLAKLVGESLEKDANIQLHMDLSPSVPPVMADKNGLKQVFINLIKNASEAMTEGGKLTIQTRHKYIPFGQDPLSRNGKHQGYIAITFKDDGPGVSDEIKSRLFEPYVSTKGKSHAGLGLSIAHNIIKTFKGNITCESKQAKGTVFKIELPVIQA